MRRTWRTILTWAGAGVLLTLGTLVGAQSLAQVNRPLSNIFLLTDDANALAVRTTGACGTLNPPRGGGQVRLTTDSEGYLQVCGITGGGGGDVASDTIWNAAGDLVVGTGSDTAARLAKGTALQVLRVNSGATALEWATPFASTSIDTSSEIATIVGDEVGTGALVFATNPVFTTAIRVGTSDTADAGAVRLENAAAVAWEAATPGTDLTLAVDNLHTVGGGDAFVFSTSLVPSTSGAFGLGDPLATWGWLYLPDNGVINWDNDDIILQAADNVVTWSGISSFDLGSTALVLKGLGTIELGHATDTTIARASAGHLTVEGIAVALTSGSPATNDCAKFDASGYLVSAGAACGSGGGGSVATDTIFDAAGDLAVGTGADTAARLAKGTALQYLRVNSGATALEYATLAIASADITNGTIVAADISASAAIALSQLATCATGTVASNITGGTAALVCNTYADFFDAAGIPTISGTPAQGDILYFDGSDWVLLTAGTSGQFLKTQGTGANPIWATVSGTGANQGLDNLSGVAINAALVLGTSDAFALGSTTKQWADLFLAEGGVINWDNGDATATQTNNTIAWGSIDTFDLGSTSLVLKGLGTIEVGHASDTTLARSAAGILSVEGVDLVTVSATQTLTNKTYDVEGTGNVFTDTVKWMFNTGVNQAGTASLGLSCLSALCPTATAITGTNVARAWATYPDSDGNYELQGEIKLPSDWTGALDISGVWRTSATSGDIKLYVTVACTADAEVFNDTWVAAGNVVETAKGTTLQHNDWSITGLTTTGCAAGETLNWRVYRQRTDAADTLAAAFDLGPITFTARRAK